jgi:hypothetical protein
MFIHNRYSIARPSSKDYQLCRSSVPYPYIYEVPSRLLIVFQQIVYICPSHLNWWPKKAGSITFSIAFSKGRPDIRSSSGGASELIFIRWEKKENNPQNERRSRLRCVKITQKKCQKRVVCYPLRWPTYPSCGTSYTPYAISNWPIRDWFDWNRWRRETDLTHLTNWLIGLTIANPAQNIKKPETVYYGDIELFLLRNPNNPKRDILIVEVNFRNLKGRAKDADG